MNGKKNSFLTTQTLLHTSFWELGTVLYFGNISEPWVYIVTPITGAVLASFTWGFMTYRE